ncbi:MAG: DUF2339 domain-containing protein [Bacteroidaceae bacterium]|nr:DUF2339 domain-containing protein [Bacteroidaceae bacterium]
MEFWLMIIALAALIIAINNQSAIKKLKEENKTLRQMIANLMPQPPKPQDVVSQVVPKPQEVVLPKPLPTQPVPAPRQKKNMENIVGKNILGIVATILMFIGVFAFGTLIFASLTDVIKVIGMFILAFAITGFGLFLTKKRNDVFANCVTGCGIGVLYISIFLTHLYYGMINDITTFVFIFLWSVGVSVLSKKFKLRSLSYIALVGCVISSILAQVSVVEKQMFIEITIYHMLTFILLIIANKDNVILFKMSSYFSIALNTILSAVIMDAGTLHDGNINWLYLCFVLGLYNLAICVMSYKQDTKQKELDSIFNIGAHCVNLLVTCLMPLYALLENAMPEPEIIPDGMQTFLPVSVQPVDSILSTWFFVLAAVIIAVSYIAYHFVLKDQKKRTTMLITTEGMLAALTLIAPIELVTEEKLGFLLLLPVANMLLSKLCTNRKPEVANTLYWAGFVFLLIDCISSMFFVFQFPYIGMLYSAALIGLSLWYMHEQYGDVLHFPFFQSALINCHLLFTLLSLFDKMDGGYLVALIITVGLNMALSAWIQLRKVPHNNVSRIMTEVLESIVAFAAFFVVMESSGEYVLGSFILSVLLIPFVLIRLKNVIVEKKPFMSVWYGIKFTFYTFATVNEFTAIADQQFIVSVFLMVLACACIVFGFWKKVKPLRIYGLVLIMSSVFKMVILDVWNQESIIRVISLIAGALICFGISAGYSKIEAKQQELIEE